MTHPRLTLNRIISDLIFEYGNRAVISALAQLLENDGEQLNDDTLRKAASQLRHVADDTLNIDGIVPLTRLSAGGFFVVPAI